MRDRAFSPTRRRYSIFLAAAMLLAAVPVLGQRVVEAPRSKPSESRYQREVDRNRDPYKTGERFGTVKPGSLGRPESERLDRLDPSSLVSASLQPKDTPRERSNVPGLTCCEFVHPKDPTQFDSKIEGLPSLEFPLSADPTQFDAKKRVRLPSWLDPGAQTSATYRQAEQWMTSHYFGRRFDTNEYQFLFTSDNTRTKRLITSSKAIPSTLLHNEVGWVSNTEIASRFAQLRASNPDLHYVVVVGHQENGQVTIRQGKESREVPVDDLKRLAQRAGLELLMWGCASADLSSGGVKLPFREGALISALQFALADMPTTFGAFLDAVGSKANVQFVYDAVETLMSRQATVFVRDSDGVTQTVDMPAPDSPVVASTRSDLPLPSLPYESSEKGTVWEFVMFVGQWYAYGFVMSYVIFVMTAMFHPRAFLKDAKANTLAQNVLGSILIAHVFGGIVMGMTGAIWLLGVLFGVNEWSTVPVAAILASFMCLVYWLLAHMIGPPALSVSKS
jgi:hypothetical protein